MKQLTWLCIGLIVGTLSASAILYPRVKRAEGQIADIYKNTYGGTPDDLKQFQYGLLDIVGPEEALEYVKEDYKSRVINKGIGHQTVSAALHVGILLILEKGQTDEAKRYLSQSIASFYSKHKNINPADGPQSHTIWAVVKQIEKAAVKSGTLNKTINDPGAKEQKDLQPSAP
jgi:hypothetical protein